MDRREEDKQAELGGLTMNRGRQTSLSAVPMLLIAGLTIFRASSLFLYCVPWFRSFSSFFLLPIVFYFPIVSVPCSFSSLSSRRGLK